MKNSFLGKEGQKYGDFVLINIKEIEELQATLRELLHLPTGAQVMHIENDDPENLFCLSFKTLPSSSNGVPHILEHTVLCGSRKYPIKDPFFAMTRRSLNTFMNALTGSDFTCYPASTQVEKDFYNLLEVYIDAVFHPQLKELSFLQEGHRLEFSSPKDPSSLLEIKGVVYNEMKGSLASVDARIWHTLMQLLVPDLPYAFNSGGNPQDIPHLTYQELIEFHETYYHASRCLFFFYGNFPLEKHLDFINVHALKGVKSLPPLESIKHQSRFEKPVYASFRIPTNEKTGLAKKHIHVFGWLTTPLLNQEELLALTILDSIFMDTDASPLKNALLETQLCIQVESALDTEMTEIPYILICRGCKKEDAEALEKALFTKLENIAQEGIPFSLVESSIHQLELARTEINGDHGPFGLALFMRSALAKQHGCSPENALSVHSLFSSLLEKTRDIHFFSSLIRKYFLHNTHFVRSTFSPDPNLTTEEIEEEKKHLENIKASLTEKQVNKILEQTAALAKFQKQIEGQKVECLPKVTLKDVPPQTRQFELISLKRDSLEIYYHEAFTNHILYTDLIFDLPLLTEEELFDLQLFVILWPELGVGKRSYIQNLEYIHANTGGVGSFCSLYVQAKDSNQFHCSLHLKGRALERKSDKLLSLFEEMITSPKFDEHKRIKDLLKKLINSLQTRLTQNATRYAIKLSLAGFSIPCYLDQCMYGIDFFKQVEQFVGNLSKNFSPFIERLQKLKEKILCVGTPHLVLSCDYNLFKELDKKNFYGLSKLTTKKIASFEPHYSLPSIKNQARPISSPVAFSVEGFKVIDYLHEEAPALQVSTLLLDNKVLHHRIRERGGAYGTGANYNSLLGNFYFYSYRDPHIAHTLRTFHDSIHEISQGIFDEKDLEEAKLGIIQQLDLPSSPGSRGLVAYTWKRQGKTMQMRQHFRDKLLSLHPKDIIKALKTHLEPQLDKGVIVVFAGQELLDKELALLEEKTLEVIPL